MKARFPLLLLLLLAGAASLLHAQEGRVEQARQLQTQTNAVREQHSTVDTALGTTPTGGEDESFGVQELLKRQEKEKSFRVYAEITGFVTNNVALTHRNTISDQFLVATFGMEYHKALAPGLSFDATARGVLFRYNRVSALNFLSLDTGAGLNYHASRLWDLDFSLGYNFTDLINDRRGDSFFQNHAIVTGVQKNIPLSRAHYFYLGASALFGFADPRIEQRDEYSAYAGYHLQATRHLEAELLYRYSHYVYAEQGRQDNNQTASVTLHYALSRFVSIFGSGYLGFNRSNYSVFDYDVGNAGAGAGVNIRF